MSAVQLYRMSIEVISTRCFKRTFKSKSDVYWETSIIGCEENNTSGRESVALAIMSHLYDKYFAVISVNMKNKMN